jgi:hypothetical protein
MIETIQLIQLVFSAMSFAGMLVLGMNELQKKNS